MHWLNALAVIVLLMSGWRIYNATAFLGFAIPKSITLCRRQGWAMQWHFAAMCPLCFHGFLYLSIIPAPGPLPRKFCLLLARP